MRHNCYINKNINISISMLQIAIVLCSTLLQIYTSASSQCVFFNRNIKPFTEPMLTKLHKASLGAPWINWNSMDK